MPRKPPQRPSYPVRTDAPWLLDLFCCAGGAGVGYYRAGFNVVGVDIIPQPRYPFTFVQADALDVLAGLIDDIKIATFAAVHASPPCQAWSDLQKQSKIEYEDFIGRTRELLAPLGLPYIIENVEGAPLKNPVKLCGAGFRTDDVVFFGHEAFPDLRVIRHRLFESNVTLFGTQCPKKHPLVFTYDKRKPHHKTLNQDTAYVQVTGGGNCSVANKREAMGTPWMTGVECNEAIPPAYTELLGRQLINHIKEEKTAVSRTTRTHLPTDRHASRAHTRRKLRTREQLDHKTHKACRGNDKARLRQEHR
jgi:DNA (cytosine-5)-methyltransferase 1